MLSENEPKQMEIKKKIQTIRNRHKIVVKNISPISAESILPDILKPTKPSNETLISVEDEHNTSMILLEGATVIEVSSPYKKKENHIVTTGTTNK